MIFGVYKEFYAFDFFYLAQNPYSQNSATQMHIVVLYTVVLQTAP